MSVKWSLALALLALGACTERAPPAAEQAAAAPAPRLEEVWRLEGLANPESVVLAPDGETLYVTNVAGEGEAKDGQGFVSRVSVSGRMIEREWVRGLDAPKGIALHEGRLYVADIDRLVVIDPARAAVTQRIALPGAVFLNDVAVLPDGLVLIADSGGAKIYAVRAGQVEIYAEGPLLDSVNGILVEPQRLVITTMAGRLLALDPATRAIATLAEGLGDADGVAPVAGGYLVSEWPGLLHFVRTGGARETLIDSREARIYRNDFLLVGDTLYQPNWEPSTLTAYRVVTAP